MKSINKIQRKRFFKTSDGVKATKRRIGALSRLEIDLKNNGDQMPETWVSRVKKEIQTLKSKIQ